MTSAERLQALPHRPSPTQSMRHFRERLLFYVDPHDLAAGLASGAAPTLLFCADQEFYEAHHVPGAEWVHYSAISAQHSPWPLDKMVVVYGKGGACNVGPKAAVRLAALGYAVKELDGGMAQWIADGFPIVTGREAGAMPRATPA